MSMPVLGGHDLCRAVTDNNPSPPPVIFLSARTLPSDRVLGLEAGLDVTASAGVAVWTASLAEPADLLGAADAALYAAKRGGRGHARLSAA